MPVEQPPSGLPTPQEVHCVLHDGIVTFVGSSTMLLSHFSPEEFHGRHISEIVHPDDWPQLEGYLAPGWTGEFRAAVRIKDSDGNWNRRFARGVRTADSSGGYSAVVVLRTTDTSPPPTIS